MQKKMIENLCCPMDKSDLKITVISEAEQKIILECPVCKRYYPIVKGIPIMSPDNYREHSLEIPLIKKWNNRLAGKYKKEGTFELEVRNEQ